MIVRLAGVIYGDSAGAPERDVATQLPALDAVEEDDLQDELVRLVARFGATEMRASSKRLAPAAGEDLLAALAHVAQEAELAALRAAFMALWIPG